MQLKKNKKQDILNSEEQPRNFNTLIFIYNMPKTPDGGTAPITQDYPINRGRSVTPQKEHPKVTVADLGKTKPRRPHTTEQFAVMAAAQLDVGNGNYQSTMEGLFDYFELPKEKRQELTEWFESYKEKLLRLFARTEDERRTSDINLPPEVREQIAAADPAEIEATVIKFLLSELKLYSEEIEEDDRLNPFLLTRKGTLKSIQEKVDALNSLEGTASKTNRAVVVISFDLDEFKLVNDLHGHQTGDEVLMSVGRAFKEVLRNEDEVSVREDKEGSHFSGDEFAAVLVMESEEELDDEKIKQRIGEIVSNIQQLITKPSKDGQGTEIQEISSGIAIARTGESRSAEALFNDADEATNESKIVKIMKESNGGSIASSQRIIDFNDLEKLKALYSKKERNIASATRGLRRSVTEIVLGQLEKGEINEKEASLKIEKMDQDIVTFLNSI